MTSNCADMTDVHLIHTRDVVRFGKHETEAALDRLRHNAYRPIICRMEILLC